MNSTKEFIEKPVPTDIAKKKDRKLFKKSVKEYVDLIHKRSPEIDWGKMDSDLERYAFNNTSERQNYINQMDTGILMIIRLYLREILKVFGVREEVIIWLEEFIRLM